LSLSFTPSNDVEEDISVTTPGNKDKVIKKLIKPTSAGCHTMYKVSTYNKIGCGKYFCNLQFVLCKAVMM